MSPLGETRISLIPRDASGVSSFSRDSVSHARMRDAEWLRRSNRSIQSLFSSGMSGVRSTNLPDVFHRNLRTFPNTRITYFLCRKRSSWQRVGLLHPLPEPPRLPELPRSVLPLPVLRF